MKATRRCVQVKSTRLAVLATTALLGALPLQASEWRRVEYLCGTAGAVQAEFSQTNSKLAVVTIAGHRWSGTLDGGSLQVFTPDHPSNNSPWMSFYKDAVTLYQGKSWSLAEPAPNEGMVSCHVKTTHIR